MGKIRFRQATQSEETQFASLLDQDIDDLYGEFGKRLGTLEPGRSSVAAAKKWIKDRAKQLHGIICDDGGYREFVQSNKNARPVDIVACVADLLAASFGALPVYTLSSLLVRQGLDEFCDCE